MSVVRVSGAGSAALISDYVQRDISNMSVGGIRYCVHADPEHRVRSDLTVWKLDDEVFEVMSGEAADVKRLAAQSTYRARVEDLSACTAIFAVQGPLSLARILPACEERSLERSGTSRFAMSRFTECRPASAGWVTQESVVLSWWWISMTVSIFGGTVPNH